ncbi:hypothetical protein TNIN_110091 [Trichonephila inaurata madagascariensis]|uniref:Uncharacterized protein n=1 Tax=Trichonephila inaurata madagascariensis TaxID=2747483 RepID=A0A8X7C891_9ARAC|nr:hypothetical protein TNIN_110091 [Trichonephila inaurata madagascariensis]
MPTPPARPLWRGWIPLFLNEIEGDFILITRCDKSTQTISPTFMSNVLDLGKSFWNNNRPIKTLSNHQTGTPRIPFNRLVPKTFVVGARQSSSHELGNNGFIIQPTNVRKMCVNK